MTIHLTPELEAFVQTQVKAGRFRSPDDVMAAALQQLREAELAREMLDDDEAALDEAEAEIAAGLDRPWDEVEAELRRKYLDRMPFG